MANLFQPSLMRADDSDGAPSSGAKMYFYATGTATLATVWLDQSGTVAAVNPVIADSVGMFPPLYVDPETTYRVKRTNSSGSETHWDIDPVRGYDEGAVQSAAASAIAAAATVTALAAQVASDADQVEEDAEQVAADRLATETASGLALAVAGTGGFPFQNDPGTPTVPPSGAGDGDQYWAVVGSVGVLYLNTTGTGAPVEPEVTIPLGNLVQDAIDYIPPLVSLLDTTARRIDGIQSPSLGSGNSALETDANTCWLLSEASGRAGILSRLRLKVKTEGNGTIKLVRATGTLPGPLAFVASTTISAGGTGTRTFTDVMTRQADEHVLISVPTGGPNIFLLQQAGMTGYLKASGDFTTGTKTLAADADPRVISGEAQWNEYGEPAIATGDLDADLAQTIAALTEQLVDADSVYGREDLLYSQTANPAGRQAVFASITADDTISRVEAYFSATGTAKLIHERGGEGLPYGGFIMSVQDLTVSATGETVWEAPGDFTAIEVKAGDILSLWTPLTGGATLHRDTVDSAGKNHYYYAREDAAPVIGNPSTGATGVGGGYDTLANQETMARAIGTQKVLEIADEEAGTPLQYVAMPILGQSNAVGVGTDTIHLDIPADVAKQFYSSALSDLTGDPVGNAGDASPWPAFAIEYNKASQYRNGPLFVPSAVLGSPLLAASATYLGASSHWSSTGTLRSAAVAKIQAAWTAADAAGLSWKKGPILWVQGESDAIALDGAASGVSKAAYKAEMLLLKAYFETQLGYSSGQLPWIFCRIGWETSGGSIIRQAAFTAIQEAQDELCQENAGFYMGYRGATTFPDRNYLGDTIHYGASARIEVGRAMAIAAFSVCG